MSTADEPVEEAEGSLERPAVVYLDWNVMQDVIDGRDAGLTSVLHDLRSAGFILVPFTREHVVEGVRGLALDTPEGRARMAAVIAGISNLTDDVYFYEDQKSERFILTDWPPAAVYEWTVEERSEPLSSDDPKMEAARRQLDLMMEIATNAIRNTIITVGQHGTSVEDLLEKVDGLSTVADPSARMIRGSGLMFEALRRTAWSLEQYGFAPKEMNNIPPGELAAEIDARLKRAGSPMSLEEIDRWSASNVKGYGKHPVAARIGMLAAVGYRSDPRKISAESQMSDLGHANLGLHADLFVTNDRRFRDRCRVAAEQLQLGVLVASSAEAAQILQNLVEDLGMAEAERDE